MADPVSSLDSPVLELRGFRGVFLNERDGPLAALLLALTAVAGMLDAVSILRLGGVFVATVTGNLVFLGLAAAGAKSFAVGTSALAIGGFVVGVPIGGHVCRAARSHRGRALRNVMAVKLCLAGSVLLIAVLTGPRFTTNPVRDIAVVLLAISMGAQLAVIRYLKVPDLLTVLITMTLIGALTERAVGWKDPKLLRRALALAVFILGVVSGGLLVLNVGIAPALGLGLAILVAVAIGAHTVSNADASWCAPT
ncbi:MAG: YoaK family protein [Solirubrobacteraceae bacterium]